MQHRSSLIALLACAVALTACGPKPDYQPPAEQSAQQQSHSDSGFSATSALLGGMFGFMLGNSSRPQPTPPATHIYQQPAVAPQSRAFTPTPTPAPVPPIKAATAPAPQPVAKAPVPAAPSAVKPPVPTAQPAPKPSYAGPSGYSSVRQSAPVYRAPVSVGRR